MLGIELMMLTRDLQKIAQLKSFSETFMWVSLCGIEMFNFGYCNRRKFSRSPTPEAYKAIRNLLGNIPVEEDKLDAPMEQVVERFSAIKKMCLKFKIKVGRIIN